MKGRPILNVCAFCSGVIAHGQITGIIADGRHYEAYLPYFKFEYPPPKVVGWSIPQDSKNGPVYPSSYNKPDIICNIGASPGAISVPVTAGRNVELQWSPWPVTHHGPVLDYLANCNGPCSSVDKQKLEFNKIDSLGLLRESTAAGKAGYWAADKLRDTNSSWTVTIPSTIAPGNYVLRHEIIALHSARVINGAQNYPHCINLEIKSAGTDKLAQGTLGTELYKENDPGILIDIYKPLTYTMPGPVLYRRSSGSSSSVTTVPYSSSTAAAHVASQPAHSGSTPSLADIQKASMALNHGTSNAYPSSPSSSPHTLDTMNTNIDNSPPKIAEVHETANSLFSSSPSRPGPKASALPDLATGFQPAASHTTTAPTQGKPKPCTRRVRITTSTPLPSTPPSRPTATSPSSSPPQDQTQALPPATSSRPLLPATPPTDSLDGLSVQQLMAWLRAVVAALGKKMHGGASRKRGHSRGISDLYNRPTPFDTE